MSENMPENMLENSSARGNCSLRALESFFAAPRAQLKICGAMTLGDVAAICGQNGENGSYRGADYIGFVFCEPESSRHHLRPEEAAPLVRAVLPTTKSVGLFVNPTDEELDAYLAVAPVEILQLHGQETPARTKEIREKTGCAIIKVFHIAAEEDLKKTDLYTDVADAFLFDTKTGTVPTGGTGKSFNWHLLLGKKFGKPAFLAGGLNLDNIAEAAKISGLNLWDLSSGAETDRRKDPEKIRALLAFRDQQNGLVLQNGRLPQNGAVLKNDTAPQNPETRLQNIFKGKDL